MNKKKIKRKLNVRAFVLFLLIIYLIIMVLYTFFTRPIKNIYINNTSLLTDNEIIEAAGIKDYPSMFRLSKKKLQKDILALELVNDVTITKSFGGKLIIDIDEARPLFYNRNTNKVVLSNGLEVDNSSKYLGIPTLINYVPTDLLNSFIEAFKEIDLDVIGMINEIEYDPDISNDVVIDDSRFLLRMNDGNIVYVNVINMKRLDDYKEFFAMIDDNRGTLYLDSYNGGNNLLGLFEYFTEDDEAKDSDGDAKD